MRLFGIGFIWHRKAYPMFTMYGVKWPVKFIGIVFRQVFFGFMIRSNLGMEEINKQLKQRGR